MGSTTSGRTDDSRGPADTEPELSIAQSGSEEDMLEDAASQDGCLAAGTLIVCPTSVLHQWHRELRDKVTAAAGKTAPCIPLRVQNPHRLQGVATDSSKDFTWILYVNA